MKRWVFATAVASLVFSTLIAFNNCSGYQAQQKESREVHLSTTPVVQEFDSTSNLDEIISPVLKTTSKDKEPISIFMTLSNDNTLPDPVLRVLYDVDSEEITHYSSQPMAQYYLYKPLMFYLSESLDDPTLSPSMPSSLLIFLHNSGASLMSIKLIDDKMAEFWTVDLINPILVDERKNWSVQARETDNGYLIGNNIILFKNTAEQARANFAVAKPLVLAADNKGVPICKDTEHPENDSCYANVRACNDQEKSAQVESGQIVWVNGQWGSCQVESCNSGYQIAQNTCIKNCDANQHVEGNQCVDNVRACNFVPPIQKSTQTWTNGVWGQCEIESCLADHHIESDKCVSNTRVCSNVTNAKQAESYWQSGNWTSCKIIQCNTGYFLNKNSNKCYYIQPEDDLDGESSPDGTL